ncbi:hypothetical protein MLD38_036225 [Melastoma candidum]|uniref:Uncharacterized protein n=1 Tax=Melastoma candidum TaxID=119954 RepID=A0ACB9LJ30_9MYRT|nr:hypothetical protein MLD38_036225 [Melastoma candidum]
MADPVSYGPPDRDIDQALISLKKGSQLIKYSRQGKPKVCTFRLSPDETTLIWYSRGGERSLNLSTVLRIIPGQRTAVFRRYLRPEKDYLSFSLIYNNGERSLDLICKDQSEVEIWLAGLRSLISPGQTRSRHTRSEISDFYDGEFSQHGRSLGGPLDLAPSINHGRVSVELNPREGSLLWAGSDVGSERANMQLRQSAGDGFRISVSSTPSCSSGGSGQDDIESLGDVYVWGEIWTDGSDGSASSIPNRTNVLFPKALESNVVLDVLQIACGTEHIALVTKQGEVFTWGKESGGRLGHGVERDYSRPHLVEFLAITNVDSVACGEYHTCVISTLGDLFTWGDGAHNAGILGHGSSTSHWIPKRVTGTLEGLQVLSIACGTWHTALVTSNGKLFTFGEGTFGVLGHGDRESVHYPKEVQLLSGLKTIRVACGLWHTAAIVEVMSQSGSNMSSRKLFTWGDGDQYRLGHGNKDTYLLPTCISSLIDYNFHQLACGHTMTVALTTSGHVFTMGSSAYGQLGCPNSDGKSPSLVQDKLVGEFVEEISCGAFHVAILTSRSEIYTWGRGANGRLGHGDIEDRKVPTMVETLKDKHVKSVSCGSNFTASICIHKWVSGVDQSVCTICRQPFGFTRKRHNCYNCGMVHCHTCSSKKALKAALAPTPGKPHRVCDTCYSKLKAIESGNAMNAHRRAATVRRSIDIRDKPEKMELVRSSRLLLFQGSDQRKYPDLKIGKLGGKMDRGLLQVAFPSPMNAIQNGLKPVVVTTPPPPAPNSRPASPYSRRPSPPRSPKPIFSRGVIDSLSKSNDFLNQEIKKLQNQLKSLRNKYEIQEVEIKKLTKESEDASSRTAQQTARYGEARRIVDSISMLLKDIRKTFLPEVSDTSSFDALQSKIEALLINVRESEASTSSRATSSSGNPNLMEKNVAERNSKNVGFTSRESRASNQQEMGNASSSGQEVAMEGRPGDDIRSSNLVALEADGVLEMTEQFEPGVYVTLDVLSNGVKAFKRVRFSKRRFAEQQAEQWWTINKDRVLKKYPPLVTSSMPGTTQSNPESASATNDAAQSP